MTLQSGYNQCSSRCTIIDKHSHGTELLYIYLYFQVVLVIHIHLYVRFNTLAAGTCMLHLFYIFIPQAEPSQIQARADIDGLRFTRARATSSQAKAGASGQSQAGKTLRLHEK
jgi:hypothetical protein